MHRIPEGEEGPRQERLYGERYEWNDKRIGCKEIDIISILSGREKD